MEIVRHLEERYPDPPLYPADDARAEMLIFIDWFTRSGSGRPTRSRRSWASRTQTMSGSLCSRGRWRQRKDGFEAMLAGRDHLMGEDFSGADCAAFPFLKYALFRDPADDELFHRILDKHQQLGETHPRLADWLRRVNERPRA